MMKKMIMAVAATVIMSATTMAQEKKDTTFRGPRMDRTEMVKKRTDETVKRYGLNEEQAAQLFELNTKYADKMRPGRGQHPRGERRMAPDSSKERRHHDGDMGSKPEKAQRQGMRPGQGKGHGEWQKTMEEYDAELKNILTEEQYKAYKEDMEKRMKEMPRRRAQKQE